MKTLTLIILCSFACQFGFAQNRHQVDSLKHALLTAKEDTIKVRLLLALAERYIWTVQDTALIYAQQSLKLAEKLNDVKGIARSEVHMSSLLTITGNFPLALEYGFKARSIYEKLKDTIRFTYPSFPICFREQEDYANALKYQISNLKMLEVYFSNKSRINAPNEKQVLSTAWGVLCSIYQRSNQLDSAIKYGEKAYKIRKDWVGILYELGNAYAKKGQYDKAMPLLRKGLFIAKSYNFQKDKIEINNGIARIFLKINKADSAVFYFKNVFADKFGRVFPKGLLDASNMLATIYESQNKPDSAYKYLKQSISLKDTLFNQGKTIAIQNLFFKEDQKKKELEAAEITYQNRLQIYGLLSGLIGLLMVAFFLWRNNRHKQKANNLLHLQKKEINLQKEKVEKALTELKQTQNQLIQKEKLASLGELTAGIAHEIQNPLNFVNNFSELSVDLIKEIQEERGKTPDTRDEELENELLSDLSQNQEKINIHGKRASNIVKGMLEHSRTSTGERVLTDINQLADEYLRLSYHGFRAKDKDFNVDFKTDFDENLPKIKVIPQDIGRVLLNLYNNAFYTVAERSRSHPIDYQPMVEVSTQLIAGRYAAAGGEPHNQALIKVKDNGTGIPESVKAKIFQPFFTTKPTGEGTGLGLSLSYDIITKGHGGELKVATKEGEFTEFIIVLPFKENA